MTRKTLPSLLLALCLALLAPSLAAASTGGDMPWNNGLTQIADNLTGPTAYAVGVALLGIGGILYAFAGHREGAKTLAQVIIGIAVAVGGAAFLAKMGVTGAVTAPPSVESEAR
jgi:type IV secretion system protein TrbC